MGALLAATSSGTSVPLTWISAVVGVATVLTLAVKAGRILGATEAHLQAQDVTLAAQDEALKKLDAKLDTLAAAHPRKDPDD